MGISGVIISPELGREDILGLPAKSALPLGIVASGVWPLCISRTASKHLALDRSFKSPKGEAAFTMKWGTNYWTYPNWELDLSDHRQLLIDSGYRLFVRIQEPIPKEIEMKKREGVWNWNLGLS
jgi:U32 family peptidase